MFLSKDEKIISEWEYAKSKSSKDVITHTLTVTNKRIVSTVQSSKELLQREIPISSVENVSFLHYKPSILLGVMLIILGALIMVIGAFLPKIFIVKLYFLIIVLLVGLAVIIIGITRLKKSSFVVSLSANTKQEQSLMSLGVENKKAIKASTKTYNFKVNDDVANEMIDSLGAIIAQYR